LVVYNNEFVLGSACVGSEMINRIATNTSNNYYLSKRSHASHDIIFITACAQNVLLQHERKRWTLTPLANSMFNNTRPRAAHSLLMRYFTSSMYNLKMNIISVKWITDF